MEVVSKEKTPDAATSRALHGMKKKAVLKKAVSINNPAVGKGSMHEKQLPRQ